MLHLLPSALTVAGQFISHEEGRIVVSGEKLLLSDGCENTGNKTASNATMVTETANGEQYIKVTANGTTVKTGVFPIGGSFPVVPGERYRIRAKGYRTGANAVYLLIKANTIDLGWPGSALPNGAGAEAWVEQIVTIPTGETTLQAGVAWEAVTAGQVFYLKEFEIVQLTAVTPEYQYHLKDHLGNVRVTFTSKDEIDTYTATLENNTQTEEQATFRNYSRVTNDIYDHTDAGTTYDKAQLLNGGNNSQVGLTKSLAVMPGDTVTAEVYAKYFESTGGSGNLTGFAAALLSAFGLPTPTGGEAGTAAAAIQSYGAFIAGGGNSGTSGWLNMLVFDKDFNLVDLAYEQLDEAYMQPVGNPNKLPMQQLSVTKTIKEPGYVYIYLSNEGNVQQDIYFDDLTITHEKSRVVQADDYYPFGLNFNSYQRENSIPQDYKYNGKEEQTVLNLGWLDYGARMYQPDLGKFFTQDRFAEKYHDTSPYSYASNNPILYVDINGDSVWVNSQSQVDKQGNTTITHTVNVTGKVLKDGTGSTSAASLASGLNSRLNSQGSTVVTKDANGNTVTVITKMNANFTAAGSMDDVSKSDHLLVIVDGVQGKGDPKLGGGDAVGLASTPGKIAYVEGGSNIAETGFHEAGHMLGLPHPSSNSTSDPMSYTGRGANFSAAQMETILDNAISGTPNRGSNYGIMKDYFPGVSRGSYDPSTNTRPFQVAPDQRAKIPLPLINRNR